MDQNMPHIENSGQIKPIDDATVHKICSGQVVLNISIALKELVENSIDADSSIIDIYIKEFGSESIEVIDNGTGIKKYNFQNLTLKHFTSKIQQFNDLEHLCTLGFRGEALSSLCSLCDVEISTRHYSVDTGTRIKYNADGKIISEELVARQPGTSVILKNIFSTLPVRRKQFLKTMRKEFTKLCTLLYAYCLIPSGIRYSCTHTTSNGTKTKVVSTDGNKSLRENIVNVFGIKQLATLIEIKLVRPEEEILNEFCVSLCPGDELPFEIDCLISTAVHGSGRSSSDRQFYYINRRPCEPHKLMKLVNEIYRQFNSKQYPFVYLNITTKSSLVDVNITPDKRQIFLQNEKILLAIVKSSLLEAFKDLPSTYKMQNMDISRQLSNSGGKGIKRSQTEGNIKLSSFMERFAKKYKSDETYNSSQKLTINQVNDEKKMKSFVDIACKLSKNGDEEEKLIDVEEKDRTGLYSSDTEEDVKRTHRLNESCNSTVSQNVTFTQVKVEANLQSFVDIGCKLTNEDDDVKENLIEVEEKLEIVSDDGDTNANNASSDSPRKNIVRRGVVLDVNIDTLKGHLKKKLENDNSEKDKKIHFRSNLDPKNCKDAEEELQKNISKAEFEKMDIIGQFNLGFIITKLNNDLFIVDQHASDEKYNFEQMQLNTVMDTQKFVVPKLLELTAAAKSVITEHEDVFRRNGFHFKKEVDAEDSQKVYLTRVPISNNVVFGKSDVDELIFMLQDDSNYSKNRVPSKVRAMYASRACRKSIMVGKALSQNEMRRVLDHMGTIDQPWNCPHGRPTMRHLVNLSRLN